MTNDSKCPWCGNVLPQAKFIEIQERIRKEEAQKLETVKFQIRAEVQTAADKEIADKEAAILAREKKRTQDLTAQLAADKQKAEKKVSEYQAREAALKKRYSEDAEKQVQQQLSKMRDTLDQDYIRRELKLKAEFARDQDRTKKKLSDLERQLAKKTANELGDGAEIDLYDELRTLFKGDHITRVKKGEPGADIHHEVFHNGRSCGKIVYDSKNRRNWQDGYATKLRTDQLAAKAAHAILSTNTFPAGNKELCIVGEVIAISPARVVFMVQLLRNFMIRTNELNLSMEQRSDKMVQLYKLISSDVFAQRFTQAETLTENILELDVKEKQAHDLVWKKRGSITKQLKNILIDLQTDIDSVVHETVASRKRPKSSSMAAVAS